MHKQTQQHPDLFLNERSITKRFSLLLTQKYHKISFEQLKNYMTSILNMEDTIVSAKKRNEYLNNITNSKTKLQLQYYLTNIVLNGSNLSMKNLKSKY